MRRIGQLTTDDALVHQVHPLMIGTNVAAAAVSTALLWRRRPVAGLLVRYLPAMAASAAVLAFADLDRMRLTAAGRYAVSHSPDAAVAIRFAGDTLMAVAGWRRSAAGIAAGTAVLAIGWSYGLLPPPLKEHLATLIPARHSGAPGGMAPP